MGDSFSDLTKVDGVYLMKSHDCLVVLGSPPEDEDPESPDAHHCDSMGCGSVGPHTLAYITIHERTARRLRRMTGKESG